MNEWSPSDTIAVVAIGVAAVTVLVNWYTTWRSRNTAERRSERNRFLQRRDDFIERATPTLREIRSIVDHYGSAWATTAAADQPDQLAAARTRTHRAVEDLGQLEIAHPSGAVRDAASELKRLVSDYGRALEATTSYARAVSRGQAEMGNLAAVEERTSDKAKPILDAVATLTDRLHDDPKAWEQPTT
jgi:hypothetical protein